MTPERSWCGRKASCGYARRWLAKTLAAHGVNGSTADDAALVLSELVANAVTHTRSGDPGGRVTVRLRVGATRLRIEVTDQGGDTAPVARRSPPEEEHGHGLDLIDALTDQWWTRGNGAGRTVVAELAAETGP